MAASGGNLRPWMGRRRNIFSYADFPTIENSFHVRNKNSCPTFVSIKAKEEGIKLTEKNLFIAYKEIEQVGGKIHSFKTTKEGGFAVLMNSDAAATRLTSKLMKLNGIDVVVERSKTLNNSKGVIYDRKFKDMNEQELLEGFRYFETSITEVKQLKRKGDSGNDMRLGQLLISFSTAAPPRTVNILSELFEVRRWYPAPLRCRKCLRFRNHESDCKRVKICKRCANELTDNEQHTCNKTFCVNCESSAHATADNDCPEFIKEKEIVCLAVDKNLSRFQARKRWHTEHPQYVPPRLWTTTAAVSNHPPTYAGLLKPTTGDTAQQSSNIQEQLSTIIALVSSLMTSNSFPTTPHTAISLPSLDAEASKKDDENNPSAQTAQHEKAPKQHTSRQQKTQSAAKSNQHG